MRDKDAHALKLGRDSVASDSERNGFKSDRFKSSWSSVKLCPLSYLGSS